MPDDSYRLRRIAPDASAPAQRGSKSSPNPIAADAAAIEDIIRKSIPQQSPSASSPPPPNNGSPPAAAADPNTDDPASLRAQLATVQKAHADAVAALDQGRIAFTNLEHKHQQFVDANVAFTHWRDDMERQRASWADANAKFAKRHEEHKAARANLEMKYSAVLADLDELKDRYSRAKKEIAQLTGGSVGGGPPSPPLPSARPGGDADKGPRKKNSGVVAAAAAAAAAAASSGSARSVRGVERDRDRSAATTVAASGYPAQLVEQSILRERLTSDMFTLSQKVLEERATRAEEARQMAERRIFELESQMRISIR